MANTFELISSVTVGSGGAASIDFTSIPATFTDLCIELSLRNNQSNYKDTMNVKFNSSSSGYSERLLYGDGGTGSASRSAQSSFIWVYSDGATATSNTFGNFSLYIPNYAGSNYKSVSVDGVTEANESITGRWISVLNAGLWSNTSAITSINITTNTGLFDQYSTAYLYGVKNA